MTSYLHKRLASKIVAAGLRDFGIIDERRRKVGVAFSIVEIKSRLLNDDERGAFWRLPFANTTYYTVTVQPTRDGKPYGASQSPRQVLTLDEARRLAKRHIESTRARYQKKYGAISAM